MQSDVSFLALDFSTELTTGVGYPGKTSDDILVDIWYRFLFQDICTDTTVDRRMIRETEIEAGILSQFRHPNILIMVGVAYLAEGPALLLERSACTVSLFMQENRLSFASSVCIASQVASAIAHVHKQSYCYGALDAANVVLMHRQAKEPIAKLSNFSRARRIGRDVTPQEEDRIGLLTFMRLLLTNGSKNLLGLNDIEASHLSQYNRQRVLDELNNLLSADDEKGSRTQSGTYDRGCMVHVCISRL